LVVTPSIEHTIAILRGLKEKYEIYHGIDIKDNALIAAATLSNRYITDRMLPDKAIDLIDEAASSRLRIYPNPTSGISTIEFSNPEGAVYRLRLTDMTGKVLKTEENITGESFRIDREGLPGGLYFIELTGPDTCRCKLLIE